MATKPWADLPVSGPFLRPRVAAEYLGISKTTLWRMIGAGQIPAPLRLRSAPNSPVVIPQHWLDAAIAGHNA